MTETAEPDSRSALGRARFFMVKAQTAPAAEREAYEAYLDAAIVFARAALNRTHKQFHNRPWFKAVWDSLLNDDAVNFFRLHRNGRLREAPTRVGQKIVLGAGVSMADELYFSNLVPQPPRPLRIIWLASKRSCNAAIVARNWALMLMTTSLSIRQWPKGLRNASVRRIPTKSCGRASLTVASSVFSVTAQASQLRAKPACGAGVWAIARDAREPCRMQMRRKSNRLGDARSLLS